MRNFQYKADVVRIDIHENSVFHIHCTAPLKKLNEWFIGIGKVDIGNSLTFTKLRPTQVCVEAPNDIVTTAPGPYPAAL